ELARKVGSHAPPSCFAVVYTDSAGVGLTGFAKALAREWPDARVKAVELDGKAPPDRLAGQLFDELVGTDGAAEVSFRGGARSVLTLEPALLATSGGWLHEGAVVAISGGARGLGAKLALELARRVRARRALLGRH